MKSLSQAILTAALLAGGVSVVAAPATAQKKGKEQGPSLKLSNEVRNPAAQAQTALAAKDIATAEPLVAQVEAAAKTEDEKYIAAALRLNVEAIRIQTPGTSTASLTAPLDALLANPKTPPADQARYAYQRGVIAANAKDNAGAATFFERARSLGYNDPNLPLQLVKLKMEGGDVAGGTAELEKVIAAQTAAGQKVDEQLYRYAIAKTGQRKMPAETLAWIERYLTAYPTQKNWREMVVFYGIQPQSQITLDKGQKLDLYRLLRAGRSLADQYDYELYGQYAFDLGIPYETKTVLAEGKAAGKVPASSANANGLVTAANGAIANEGSLASQEGRAKAGSAKLAASTADAFLASGNNAKAVELYRVALQKGGVDTDAVNTRLGIALAGSGDKAGARTAFEAVKGAPRADVAKLWMIFLDHPPVA